MKRCPTCRVVSVDTALRCDCGYDFSVGGGGRRRARLTWVPAVAALGLGGCFAFAGACWGSSLFGRFHSFSEAAIQHEIVKYFAVGAVIGAAVSLIFVVSRR